MTAPICGERHGHSVCRRALGHQGRGQPRCGDGRSSWVARARLAIALPFVLVALALSLGCGSAGLQAQMTAAHALAGAGAKLAPELRAFEEAEGHAAIDRAAPRGAAAVEAALVAVEARWEPALVAIALLEEAVDAWATALEAHSTGDWGALLGSACHVLAVVRPLAPGAAGSLAGLLAGVCP